MNLAQSPIVYDSKEVPYVLPKGGVPKAGRPSTTLIPVPGPTFYPYRDGVGNTRLTAPSLYPANGIGDNGEVVVHEDVIEPLERARALVREAGFEIAVASGFSTPKREQRKFVEAFNRLWDLEYADKKRPLRGGEVIRIGRLAASVGTPAPLATTKYQNKYKEILHGARSEDFSEIVPKGQDTLIVARELVTYRGNVHANSNKYITSICPPDISAAYSDENFGRTLQCVLTSADNHTQALNMGIGIDIPYPLLDEPNAFEDMNLDSLRALVNKNPLAKEYFLECQEPPTQDTLDAIRTRRRVLYHAMTEAGFARGKRQANFTLPAEPGSLPTGQSMLIEGRKFGHRW